MKIQAHRWLIIVVLFVQYRAQSTSIQPTHMQASAKLFHIVLSAKLKPTFYKINVHAAMTPADIEQELAPVICHAKQIKEAYMKRTNSHVVENYLNSSNRRRTPIDEDEMQQATIVPQHTDPHESPPSNTDYKMPFVTVSACI